jgi:hypothetical protein
MYAFLAPQQAWSTPTNLAQNDTFFGSPEAAVSIGALHVVFSDDRLGDREIFYSSSSLSSFTGFFSPVDNLPILNVVRAGRAVPVRFSLNGEQGLNIFEAGYPQSHPIDYDTTAPSDAIEQTVTAGSSELSYDASTDQYTYVWKTDKAWIGTCRQLVVKLLDGSEHQANFEFAR